MILYVFLIDHHPDMTLFKKHSPNFSKLKVHLTCNFVFILCAKRANYSEYYKKAGQFLWFFGEFFFLFGT